MKISHNQLVNLIKECMMEVESDHMDHGMKRLMKPRVIHIEPDTHHHKKGHGRMLDYGHQMSDSEEGRMAKSNLHTIAYMANEMKHMLHDDDDLPEWLQEKIATVKDRIQSCYSYLKYELEHYEED